MNRARLVLLPTAAALLLTPLSTGEARPRRLGAAVAPLRLIPTGAAPTTVTGLHDFFGTIELRAAGDGIAVVNRLSLEKYLLGLQEVPGSWPGEALQAQAIAARTYALHTLAQPRAGAAATYGFDICATVECQVFAGADVVQSAEGARWARAVRATAGQAVLYRGTPILARYHSTSGGATLDNPQAFPGEPSYPYLQGVPSTTEAASPLYRWRVRFSLRGLQDILTAAGWWDERAGALKSVRTIASRTGLHYPDVVFQGAGGRVVRTAEELRDVVRDLAPAMFPSLYPSAAPTSSGRLPETFPSNRIAIGTRRGVVRVVGRGWGHGVGMSQWGAHGLALRGADHRQILTHYYSGVSVGDFPDPGSIQVGVEWGLPQISVTGAFRVVDGLGRTLVKNALGTWGFRWAGTGVVEIDPPAGFGLPLRVGIVKAPRRIDLGASAFITIALSRPAEVKTVTSDVPYEESRVKVKAAGRQRIPWFAPIEAGRYRVTVEAAAGPVTRRSKPVTIVVRDPTEEEVATGRETPSDPSSDDFPLLPVGAGIVLLLVAGALVRAFFVGTMDK